MQITNFDMLENRIKNAQYRLNQHRVQGSKSNLSVFEVAKLMDTIKFSVSKKDESVNSIFFSMN